MKIWTPLIILGMSGLAMADPGLNISAVTATGTAHMAQFTIDGSNFGLAPNNGVPVVWWDGRSDSTNGSSLGQGNFTQINTASVVSSEPATGTAYIDHAFKRDWNWCSTSGDNSNYSFQLNKSMTAGTTVYTYAWRYTNYSLANPTQGAGNVKYWRFVDNGQIEDFLHSGDGDHLRSYNQKTYGPPDFYNPDFTYSGGIPSANTWHKLQYEWAHGDSTAVLGNGDGYWRFIDDGVLETFSDWYSNAGRTQNLVELQIQHVAQCPDTSAQAYFTHVYISESFFEVFGSSANSNGTCTFSSTSTAIAPQIPATWSQSQITGRLNLDNIDTTYGLCLTVRDGNRRYSNTVLLAASSPPPTASTSSQSMSIKGNINFKNPPKMR